MIDFSRPNSVANWKIEQEGIFDNVWIQPAAGDDGGSLGAALLVSQQLFKDEPCSEMKDAFLGPEFSAEEIEGFLTLNGVSYDRLDDEQLVERVADLISDSNVVGWFQGRMEFGPRALGARSILADPTDSEMKAIINQKRSWPGLLGICRQARSWTGNWSCYDKASPISNLERCELRCSLKVHNPGSGNRQDLFLAR